MTETISTDDKWSLTKRFLTLLSVSYLILYMFPWPLGMLPVIGGVTAYYNKALVFINFMVGSHLLHIEYPATRIRVGDDIFEHVGLLTRAILSVAIASLTLLINTGRKNYSRLHYWTVVYAKYFLAYLMLYYGLVKLTGVQFPAPGPVRLEQAFGDASPMVLLWTFMGYSRPYVTFSAVAEILGAYLVLFRRTRAIGALIIIAVMSNVVMINVSYGVGAKLLSLHLLLIAIFILAPDLKRIIDFFFLQRAVGLTTATSRFSTSWFSERRRLVVKSALIAGLSGYMIYDSLQSMRAYGDLRPKPPLYGVYQTESFVLNNDTVPAWPQIPPDGTN